MKIQMEQFFIGDNSPVCIVAEVSANHNNDIDLAYEMIKKAKECGADAVKFQAYTPDTMTIDSKEELFMIKHHKWGGQSLYDLYKKAYTPWEWFPLLKKECDKVGITFFATAFDNSSVDMLEDLNVPVHKIASFELVDLPLIRYAAETKKPIILSTGMASFEEIEEAVEVAREGGAENIVLLQCVSSYPANPGDMNLRTMVDMKKKFGVTVGISDHSTGIAASIVSVALGGKIIEKHFILARDVETPDSFFSLNETEFAFLVQQVREAEESIGDIKYGPTEIEKSSLKFRRSLLVVEDIKEGDILTEKNIRSIRPSDGLSPKFLKEILGKKAKKNVKRGEPVQQDMF